MWEQSSQPKLSTALLVKLYHLVVYFPVCINLLNTHTLSLSLSLYCISFLAQVIMLLGKQNIELGITQQQHIST